MEIRDASDINKMNEMLRKAGMPPNDDGDSIDMSAILNPTKDLIRAFPDEMDPEGVDEIYFNDHIQLHIWYSRENLRLKRFLIAREPMDPEKNDTAETIVDWELGHVLIGTIAQWKLRWAIAEIKRGSTIDLSLNNAIYCEHLGRGSRHETKGSC